VSGRLIRDDRRITIDSVATALGCSHGLAYSIMHDQMQMKMYLNRIVIGDESWLHLSTQIKLCFNAMEISQFTFNQEV
jgi:hypothetical protein